MRIGLFTRYQPNELTRVALQLADWLSQRHVPVTIRAKGHIGTVDPGWDRTIIHDRSSLVFTEWAKGCSAIVWTHTPPAEQLRWAKEKKIRNIYLASWDELDVDPTQAYPLFHKIVLPSRVPADMLKRSHKLTNVVTVPLYPNLPITQKGSRALSPHVRILVPLYSQTTTAVHCETMRTMSRVLDNVPDASVTILYHRLNGIATRLLDELRKEYGSRLKACSGLLTSELHLCYAQHDITVWPSQQENFGLIGATSLYLGTPVIGFDIPPINEIIRNGRNGVLLDTNVSIGAAGTRWATLHYQRLEKAVIEVAQDPALLSTLQQNTAEGLEHRMLTFNESWMSLLKL